MKTLTSVIALSAALLASPAMATDLTTPADAYAGKAPINWTSIYIGGQIGYGNSNHRLDANDYALIGNGDQSCTDGTLNAAKTGCVDGEGVSIPDAFVPQTFSPQSVANAFIDGLNSKGIFGGGTVGFDVQKGKFVFGAFADYNVSDANFTTGASVDDVDIFSGSITDGNSWIAAARAGVALGSEQRTLLYGLAGYGQQDVSYSAGGFGGTFSKDATFSGWVAGGGIEYAISQAATIGVEYQHFFGGKETLFDGRDPDTGAGVLVTDDLDTDKVMAKLKLKLSPGLFGY